MAAAQNNIYIEAGDDWSRTMTISNADGAIDISTWTFAGGVQSRLGDGHVTQFSWTKLPATGKVIVKLTAAQTAALNGQQLFYDWHYTVNGVKSRLAEGIATLSREVR
jgi:hypothetical protein